jgi:mono/diheme cytochrome c family protein
MRTTLRTLPRALVPAVAAFAVATAAAQPPAQPLVGDAERGKQLFADTFNCYACHGYDAQTGERRLVPLNYTQEGFITFVQNSPLPNMPAYPDAPAIADVPLLRDILERKTRAAGR